MKIRFATTQDAPHISALAFKWIHEMEHEVTESRILTEILDILKFGRMFLIEDGDVIGMMGVKIVVPIWNGHKVAHEHYLFVDPEYRGGKVMEYLRCAFEAWAKQEGCSQCAYHPNTFGSKKPSALCNYLMRKGYELTGYEVTKEI